MNYCWRAQTIIDLNYSNLGRLFSSNWRLWYLSIDELRMNSDISATFRVGLSVYYFTIKVCIVCWSLHHIFDWPWWGVWNFICSLQVTIIIHRGRILLVILSQLNFLIKITRKTPSFAFKNSFRCSGVSGVENYLVAYSHDRLVKFTNRS
jgi:hypothetical protein